MSANNEIRVSVGGVFGLASTALDVSMSAHNGISVYVGCAFGLASGLGDSLAIGTSVLLLLR